VLENENYRREVLFMAVEMRINGQPLVSGIPERSDMYPTPVGTVGIDLNVGNQHETQVVILDCSLSESLKGSRGIEQRVVNLGPDGVGAVMYGPGQTLEVDLQRPLVSKRPERLKPSPRPVRVW
jgi:hypothetical protein